MKMPFMKGQMTLEGGMSNAIMFGVLVITMGLIAGVLSTLQTSQLAANGSGVMNVPTTASNATGQGLVGMANLGGQLGNVGTVLAAALILTILIVGLGFLVFKKD